MQLKNLLKHFWKWLKYRLVNNSKHSVTNNSKHQHAFLIFVVLYVYVCVWYRVEYVVYITFVVMYACVFECSEVLSM